MVGRQVLRHLKEQNNLEKAVQKLVVLAEGQSKGTFEDKEGVHKPAGNKFAILQETAEETELPNESPVEVNSAKGDGGTETKRKRRNRNRKEKGVKPDDVKTKRVSNGQPKLVLSDSRDSRLEEAIQVFVRYLDYGNELAKKFKIYPNFVNPESRSHTNLRSSKRHHIFVPPGYPSYLVEADGIRMECVHGSVFKITHEEPYRTIEQAFIDTNQQENLEIYVAENHNHLNCLLYTSQMLLIRNEASSLSAVMDHALRLLQSIFHPRFRLFSEPSMKKVRNIIAGRPERTLMDYSLLPYDDYYENRVVHLLLFRHSWLVYRRNLARTALEIAKVLLNIDPTDPLAMILLVDMYAMRAGQYSFLVQFYEQNTLKYHLDMLPGMCYHYALALFKLERIGEAQRALMSAASKFPGTLYYLLDRLSVKTDASTEASLLSLTDDPLSLSLLTHLFVDRLYMQLWANKETLQFLESAVTRLRTFELREGVLGLYEGIMPARVRRHAILMSNTLSPEDDTRAIEQLTSLLSKEERVWAESYPSDCDPVSIYNPFPPITNICGPYRRSNPSSEEARLGASALATIGSLVSSALPITREQSENLLLRLIARLNLGEGDAATE